MKIGLTYDLRDEYLAMGFSQEETAEFDREDTIVSIENALLYHGFETVRVGNIFNVIRELHNGVRWDVVFNIAEGMHGFGREAQIPALLDAYQIPYTFSDPLILALSLHKETTKRIVKTFGIATPDFVVVHQNESLKKLNLPFPLFVKPVAEGTSKGIGEGSVVYSLQDLEIVCGSLFCCFNQPVLIERFLPGREFTVGIIGTGDQARAVGILEIKEREKTRHTIYSYEKKELCEEYIDYISVSDPVARKAGEMGVAVWKKFGCRDAGRVDFRLDENGTINFLEVNPLAGLHPTHSDLPIMWSDTGHSYEELIAEIMKSALKRINVAFIPSKNTCNAVNVDNRAALEKIARTSCEK